MITITIFYQCVSLYHSIKRIKKYLKKFLLLIRDGLRMLKCKSLSIF